VASKKANKPDAQMIGEKKKGMGEDPMVGW
jgi:hypothetical protein